MSEKVKLPKEVCEALDYAMNTLEISSSVILLRSHGNAWGTEETIILNKISTDIIMRALVLGYESELSEEEQLEELYFTPFNMGDITQFEAYRKGIKDTLKIQKCNYDWMD